MVLVTETPLRQEHADGVTTLTLDRPAAMNAFDRALKEALLAALTDAAEDPAVRCVVLTGNGRAFGSARTSTSTSPSCAPGSSWATPSSSTTTRDDAAGDDGQAVVAALNGVAAGAAASFALACDLRYAADTAGINTAFAAIALSCDSGASWYLPRLLGTAKAKELLLLPRTLSAAECLDLGLVTEVVPAADLATRVHEVAARLAAGPTLAYGSIRRAVAFSAAHPLAESLAHEARLMTLTGQSEDHAHAVEAFLAKEKPAFRGR